MKHILLPTDFSDNSWNAIKYAIQLYKNETCTFHILNTYTPVIYHVEYVLGYPAQFGLGDAVRNTAQENLKDIVSKISKELGNNPKHTFETAARFDTLISGIKTFMRKHPINMIVMGTKGATGAKEILFGSNTVHVFKEIKCPILAIPSNFDYEAPHEILFPTDYEVNFQLKHIQPIIDIASSNYARVNILHISYEKHLPESLETNRLKLENHFKKTTHLFHHLRNKEVTTAIAEFQIKSKINLLVMLNNKHSFFENLFFKSTINQIGFHLTVPFLVIPSET